MHLVGFTIEKKKVPWDTENYFRGWGPWSRLFNNNSRHTDQPCGAEGRAACIVQRAVVWVLSGDSLKTSQSRRARKYWMYLKST